MTEEKNVTEYRKSIKNKPDLFTIPNHESNFREWNFEKIEEAYLSGQFRNCTEFLRHTGLMKETQTLGNFGDNKRKKMGELRDRAEKLRRESRQNAIKQMREDYADKMKDVYKGMFDAILKMDKALIEEVTNGKLINIATKDMARFRSYVDYMREVVGERNELPQGAISSEVEMTPDGGVKFNVSMRKVTREDLEAMKNNQE